MAWFLRDEISVNGNSITNKFQLTNVCNQYRSKKEGRKKFFGLKTRSQTIKKPRIKKNSNFPVLFYKTNFEISTESKASNAPKGLL